MVAVDAGTTAKVAFAILCELSELAESRKSLTILARPLEVTMYRACMRPYRNLADVSTTSRPSSSIASSSRSS